jgi:hypothetical protein
MYNQFSSKFASARIFTVPKSPLYHFASNYKNQQAFIAYNGCGQNDNTAVGMTIHEVLLQYDSQEQTHTLHKVSNNPTE